MTRHQHVQLWNLVLRLLALILLVTGIEQEVFGAWPRLSEDSRRLLVVDRPDPGKTIRVKPSKMFQFAYHDYLKGRYDLALAQFQQFVQDFPQSSLAPEAYFYIGECFEQKGNLKKAASAFHTILTMHENSRQVPTALFRLGNLYVQAGHPEKAKTYWKKLIANFRGSPEAKLASQRLGRIP